MPNTPKELVAAARARIASGTNGYVWSEEHIAACIAASVEAERERCARLIELIAADWRAAGADQKVWASEYLVKQIRELGEPKE